MKNKEKYKSFFGEYDMCDEDAPWYEAVCRGNICKGCVGRFIEWSEQEALPDPTELEEGVLRAIDSEFKYIARDEDGKLYIYSQKPKKIIGKWASNELYNSLRLTGLFDWIRFENAEPWCIDDLVKRPALDSNTRPRDEEDEEEG